MSEEKRKIEICIISDIHLGTRACHAAELNKYLRSIEPTILIINGDWLDIWNFNAGYFPQEHIENVFLVLDMARQGIPVYYVTGNHDDHMRNFSGYRFDTLQLRDEIVLEIDGKKLWIFHGDKYDLSVGGSARWLAKLGGRYYDHIFTLNRYINNIRLKYGKDKILISKYIKDKVKSIVKSKIQDFEDVAIEIGIENGYDYIVCGHIHKPQIREVKTDLGKAIYLNSGDWVENLTALEYANGNWEIFYYQHDLQYKNIDRS
ncbi:MAG: UDP-2,3-diacylglucosamine diphosphatase [Chitinophagales bacterium]|jgi:UDP-2,3-diacylglucosamine pyrophosphatase LpxH|nr:UDP-2,3-diacylglucosamine diphosphatase [Saprospirales bacterium]MBK8350430.1 UDP-2,3-diacylglucosamine diphosphatase [Saprospirales bacterium]MBP6659341.1 UDP-2,3-diacylglucosamine diphosphatase [Chitinophagales bacterium]